MAYGFIQSNANSGSAFPESLMDCDYTTALTAGSQLIAIIAYGASTARTFTLSDIVGGNDSWNRIGTGIHNAGVSYGVEAFYLQNAASGSCTVRFTGSGTFAWHAIAVFEYSGIATTSSLVGQAFNFQASVANATDSITSGNTSTLTSQPAMVFGAGLGWDLAPTAVNSSYTSRGVQSPTVWFIGDKRVTATTAVAAQFTPNASDLTNHFSLVAAFAEAGGGDTSVGLTGIQRTVAKGTFVPNISLSL